MTKKTLFAAFFVAVFTAGTVFAAGRGFYLPRFKISAGGGLVGTGSWTIQKDTYGGEWGYTDSFVASDIKMSERYRTMPGFTLGGFLFLDATYAELDVTLGGAQITDFNQTTARYDALVLGVGLYGKFPFQVVASRFSIAPLLGAQFDMVLAAWDQWGNAVAKGNAADGTGVLLYDGDGKFREGSAFDYSTLTLKVGAEAKTTLTRKLYMNAQAMWGFTFANAVQQAYQKQKADSFDGTLFNSKTSYFTHGVTFKLGVGYTF